MTALEVMTTVKRLADRGLTICSTIHAPSPSVNSLFARLIVLLDGYLVYMGDNGEKALSRQSCFLPITCTCKTCFFPSIPSQGS